MHLFRMSEKKSFDVQRKKSRSAKRVPGKKTPTPRPRRTPSLRERREAKRQIKTVVGFGVLLASILGMFYLFWQKDVRIQDVKAADQTYEARIKEIAKEHLSGAYYAVFPRDSFLFYPEQAIEEAIREAFPEVRTVSVSRMSFTTLEVSLTKRSADFWWCGTPENTKEEGKCYEADKEGYIYKPVVGEVSSTTEMLRVYAKLDAASSTDRYPLRARVLGTDAIDGILEFSRSIEALGTPLLRIAIRDDEADVYSEGGTRITYVVGKEREAMESAKASLPKLNLMDGSVEYVDLRFSGKAYVQKIEGE